VVPDGRRSQACRQLDVLVEGVGDVEGAAGVVGPGLVGAESLGLGAATDPAALPADERACANAASGSSSKAAMPARNDGLGVSIAITMALRRYLLAW